MFAISRSESRHELLDDGNQELIFMREMCIIMLILNLSMIYR
jgi:hypothetical protein